MGAGGWIVTLVLSIFFSVVGAYWVRYMTIPDYIAGLCEAIPPVPAVAVLIFLVAVRWVLQRLGSRLRMTTAQIIAVYTFVSVCVPVGFIGFYRMVLVTLTGPLYGTQPNLQRVKEFVPGWLSPRDEVVIRQFWEGSPGSVVPWKEWLVPMLGIGGTLLLFYIVIICMLRLFYKRWSSEERLIYPIAQLALNMVEGEERRSGTGGSIFRRPIFWVGGATMLVFNLFYIIPSLRADWPVPPIQIPMGQYLANPPWSAAGLWYIRLNPVVFGLGFLVSLDVLLSIWVTFLLMKAQAVFLASLGNPVTEVWGLDYQQGLGAYAATALLTIWAARRHLLRALRRVLPGAPAADPTDAGRWSVILFVAGVGGLLLIMCLAGMALWLAAAFMVMLLVRSLVLARIRAQTGVPQIYLHVAEPTHIVWLIGGATLAAARIGVVESLVFMSFIVTATYLVPHHADALKLADRSGIGVRRWSVLAILAVVVGLVLANLTHLSAFYHHGALNVRVAWNLQTLEKHASDFITPAKLAQPVDRLKVAMAGTGFLTTSVLYYLRRFYWFPLHPAGYVVACAIGYRVFAPVGLLPGNRDGAVRPGHYLEHPGAGRMGADPAVQVRVLVNVGSDAYVPVAGWYALIIEHRPPWNALGQPGRH